MCMPLKIVRDDLSKMKVDAIVNPTNATYDATGGTDKAIHQAAGKELGKECRTLGILNVGQVEITQGYNLPATYVIHTFGPKWLGGKSNEKMLLVSCYRNALQLALEKGLTSIAFPLISAGSFGFPKEQTLDIATNTIGEFLLENEMDVSLVVFDMQAYKLSTKLFSEVKTFIDDKYVDAYANNRIVEARTNYQENSETHSDLPVDSQPMTERSLTDLINNLDETFTQMLLRLIDEKGLKDAAVYRKANVDRRLFSKIRSNPDYKPSKNTAIAFAIALHLNLDETKDLLRKAGYALSHSNKFDIIIEYFIEQGNYNVFEMNETLFAFEQKLLGV